MTTTAPSKFSSNYQKHEARTLGAHVPCTQPNSNSFTGTNPKKLYGSQLNQHPFLCKSKKILARQIKLEMGQSQTLRCKATQNSQCAWILVQILTVCYYFSLTLCHLPGWDKLFRMSPSITQCILSPSSIRDVWKCSYVCFLWLLGTFLAQTLVNLSRCLESP